ncbi:MAG TPA: glutamine amidotransferase, partial [Pirellulaceae bacterium]|nr:glutamine amidotransferase [Pirellulaceae bacterium]
MPDISFHPVAHWGIVIGLLAVLVALLWVSPSYAQVTPSRRGVLVFLRMCLIVVLGVCMIRPGCVTRVEKPQTAVINVLIDQSSSMQLPHRADQSSRWASAQSTIRNLGAVWERLRAQRLDIRYYFFDGQTHIAEVDQNLPVWPEQPEGSETDMGQALISSVRDVRDQRLVGVILMTDGVQNATDSAVELFDAVQLLADQGIPLYSVPFGLPADTGELADLAITNLAEQHRIRVKNRLNVQTTMQARGYVNQEVAIELLISSKDEAERVVDRKVVVPRQPFEEFIINLTYIPTEIGRYRMRVRCRGNVPEVALRNNELPSFLNVYEGGSRIVYLEGETNFGQMFLRPMVRRSAEGMELEFLKVDREYPPTVGTTARIQELVNDPSVDVFIIGDLDARLLGQSQTDDPVFQALAQAVAKGKGLLLLGGYHSFGAGFYHATPLAEVLPIRMGRTEGQPFAGDIRRDLHIERAFRVVPSRRHFLTQLSPAEDPAVTWGRLPPLPAANLILGVKDAALVVLETDGGEPILVIGHHGAGRVACLATELTYLWRRSGFAAEFDTFWEQLFLWL